MKRILLLCTLLPVLFACRNNSGSGVDSFIGRKITLPQGLEYRSLTDSLCVAPNASLRLVVYIDSECSRCAARLGEWAARENEFRQAGDVSILYYVRTMDFSRIKWLLRHYGFSSPVFVDPRSDLLYGNGIPETESALHTFLLDEQDRIILTGQALASPSLSEHYKQFIRNRSKPSTP